MNVRKDGWEVFHWRTRIDCHHVTHHVQERPQQQDNNISNIFDSGTMVGNQDVGGVAFPCCCIFYNLSNTVNIC